VLVDLLGVGGMARVYRALRPGPMGFAKELAIKLILPSLTQGNQALVRALTDEARLGGQLRHPNIVDVYEFGAVADERYLAMELVEGLSLETLIEGAQARGVRLPASAVLDLALQACDGLAYAHVAQGAEGQALELVHRDLKPSNILLSTAGQAKIMDFGIARATSALHRTTTPGTKGTPEFMAPEQIEEPGRLDRRVDLFALGSVLFTALTGQRLVQAQSLDALLWQIVSGEYLPRLALLDEILPQAHPILRRCVAQRREERYADATRLSSELGALREELGDRLGCKELMASLAARFATQEEAQAAGGDWPRQRAELLARASQSPREDEWRAWIRALDPEPWPDPLRTSWPRPLDPEKRRAALALVEEGLDRPDRSQAKSDERADPLPTRNRARGLLLAAYLALAVFLMLAFSIAMSQALVRPAELSVDAGETRSAAPSLALETEPGLLHRLAGRLFDFMWGSAMEDALQPQQAPAPEP